MYEQTKDELIETLQDLVRTLEEQKLAMERHIFILQHDNRILKNEISKSQQINKENI